MNSSVSFAFSWSEQEDYVSQAFKFYTDGDKLAIVSNDDYVFYFSQGEPSVKYVLFGTLMHSRLDDGMIWHFERIS